MTKPKIILFNGDYLRVHPDTLDCGMFRTLDESEQTAFRAWASAQPRGTTVSPLWHPIAQDQLLTTGRGVLPEEAL
jgi:hypothetical protein